MGTTEELAMAGSYVPYMVPLNSSEDRELWAVSWPVQLLRLTPDKNIDPESAFKFLMAQFQVPPEPKTSTRTRLSSLSGIGKNIIVITIAETPAIWQNR
jgi:hypothetical protein